VVIIFPIFPVCCASLAHNFCRVFLVRVSMSTWDRFSILSRHKVARISPPQHKWGSHSRPYTPQEFLRFPFYCLPDNTQWVCAFLFPPVGQCLNGPLHSIPSGVWPPPGGETHPFFPGGGPNTKRVPPPPPVGGKPPGDKPCGPCGNSKSVFSNPEPQVIPHTLGGFRLRSKNSFLFFGPPAQTKCSQGGGKSPDSSKAAGVVNPPKGPFNSPKARDPNRMDSPPRALPTGNFLFPPKGNETRSPPRG